MLSTSLGEKTMDLLIVAGFTQLPGFTGILSADFPLDVGLVLTLLLGVSSLCWLFGIKKKLFVMFTWEAVAASVVMP